MKWKWIPVLLVLIYTSKPLLGSSPLWGNLKPGEYAAGFTVRLEYDYTRTFLISTTTA